MPEAEQARLKVVQLELLRDETLTVGAGNLAFLLKYLAGPGPPLVKWVAFEAKQE